MRQQHKKGGKAQPPSSVCIYFPLINYVFFLLFDIVGAMCACKCCFCGLTSIFLRALGGRFFFFFLSTQPPPRCSTVPAKLAQSALDGDRRLRCSAHLFCAIARSASLLATRSAFTSCLFLGFPSQHSFRQTARPFSDAVFFFCSSEQRFLSPPGKVLDWPRRQSLCALRWTRAELAI